MSYYVTNDNSFLDIKNAHLRVTGNVHTDVMKLGAVEFAPSQSTVAGTVNFTNVTTGVTTSSNLSVGGTLSLGTVEVVATTHTLANTTAVGNVTPHTIQFSNVTTGIVTTANVEVGGELAVTGNVVVGTNKLFVDTVGGTVGIGSTLIDITDNTLSGAGNGLYIHNPVQGGHLLTLGTQRPWVFEQGLSDASTQLCLRSLNSGKKFNIQSPDHSNVMTVVATNGGGNVGIGTTSPSGKLQVYDDTNTRSLLNVREGSGTAARTEINTGIRFDTYSVENYAAGGSSTASHNYHILFNTNRKMALYYDGNDLKFSWGGGGSYTARASVGNNAEFGFTFTGQHRNFIKDISYKEVIEKELGGLIVCANNNEYVKISDGIAKGSNAITQNEALPIVSLSLKALDKSCFGVISESEDPNSNRGGSMGMFKSYYDTEDGDKRIIINSVGEGAIWVTNINGSLESGDYITTSNVAGYGQKQDSEFLANYTVAKITMDCDFEPVTQSVQIIRKEMGDVNYWVKTTYKNVSEEEYSNLIEEKRRIVDDIYQEIIKEESKTEQEGYELEVRQELVNVLDEHGQIQWEDHPTETEKAYKIRYLDASGVETDEASAVHKAAFVGCTYHCG